MINNQIEYKINKTLVIDKFTITDKAEALLASLLMTRSFSGKELISLITISQDLKQCIRYLAEKEFGLTKEPFYEEQLNQMKKKTKQLGLEKILNIKYLNSYSAEKNIKKIFEEIMDIIILMVLMMLYFLTLMIFLKITQKLLIYYKNN